MQRVYFLAGSAAFWVAVPKLALAAKAPAPDDDPKTHVHGANGIVSIPEGRPLELKMQVLDGPDFRLSAYAGNVVFLNVFATWCGPCREEQPDLSAFAKEHAADTSVIGLNYREEDNDVRKYRKQFEIDYPIAMDREGRVVPNLAIKELAVPMTLVVRPDRTLSCAWRGDRYRAWFEREREAALAPVPERVRPEERQKPSG